MASYIPVIGIDFGTSNSKMAWYDPKSKEAKILLNAEGEQQTPSVVYLGKTEAETKVGTPAEEMLEDEQERQRVILSIKRELVKAPRLTIADQFVTSVDIAIKILQKLKHDAEAYHFHQEVKHAVITYPATFDTLEQEKIEEIARKAGFEEVFSIAEPVAAAYAYAQMGQAVGEYVLVYDLGGGTFDLAVLRREEDGTYDLALEPQGIKQCGGDDFDQALYQYYDDYAVKTLERHISLTGERDPYFLRESRRSKEKLTNSEKCLMRALLAPDATKFLYEITLAEFNTLITGQVEKTVQKTKAILKEATGENYALDSLVLVGGSSRVPLVEQLLKQALPIKLLKWQYQHIAVALGAAYYAHNRWNTGTISPDKTSRQKTSQPLIEYHKLIEDMYADKRMSWAGLTQLRDHVRRLGITPYQAAEVERELLGETKETIFEQQVSEDEYNEAFTRLPTPINHNHSVWAVAISPDGQTLVTAGNAIRIWNIETGQLLRRIVGHNDSIHALAINFDGKTFVSGSKDRTIKLWNLQTGELIRTFVGHTGTVFSLNISPSGHTLVSGSEDRTIKLWNIATGQLLSTLTGHTDVVCAVAFTPNRRMLISASDDRTIKLWDPHTGQLLNTLTGHTHQVNALAIAADEETFVSASSDQTIKQWDIASGQVLYTFGGHSNFVWAVALSPDGQTMVSGSAEITIWNFATRQLLHTEKTNYISSIAFSPDNHTFAAGSTDNTIRVWQQRKAAAETDVTIPPPPPELDDVRTTGPTQPKPDTQPKREQVALKETLAAQSASVTTLAISRDANTLVSGYADNYVCIWNFPARNIRRKLFMQPTPGHASGILAAAISPANQFLAVSSENKFNLWHLTADVLQYNIAPSTGWLYAIAFSLDGQVVATGSSDTTIKILNTPTGEQLRVLPAGMNESVMALAFSPTGQLLVSGHYNSIMLWSPQQGQLLLRLQGHVGGIRSVAFSPNGLAFATAGNDRMIRLWKPTGEYIRDFVGHSDAVHSIAFSPDGNMLVSGSADKTLKLWNPYNGENLMTLTGHTDKVRTVAFAPEGKNIVSGSADTTIKIWEKTPS